MCPASAHALADVAIEDGLDPAYILPTVDEWDLFPHEAAAVAAQAVAQGISRLPATNAEEYQQASDIIRRLCDMTRTMMADGCIAESD
jgi:malate dehydrogenase (oxaloacetate-decarboxylating)